MCTSSWDSAGICVCPAEEDCPTVRSTTALVPVIGPRTVDQVDLYLAALDVELDDEQFQRLDLASRIRLRAPYEQLASQPTAPLGGDPAVIAPADPRG